MKDTVMFSRKQGAWQVLLMSHNKSRRQVKEERRSLVTHLPRDRGQVSDERLPVVTGLTCTENSFPQGNWLILRHNSTQSIAVCKAQLDSHVRRCVRWGPPALITFLIVLLSLNLQDFFFMTGYRTNNSDCTCLEVIWNTGGKNKGFDARMTWVQIQTHHLPALGFWQDHCTSLRPTFPIKKILSQSWW